MYNAKRWQEVRDRLSRRTLIRANNFMIAVVCVMSVVGYIVIIK